MKTEAGESRAVGYWMSAKKLKKLNMVLFEKYCRVNGITLTAVNLDDDLEVQGPFQLILHKLSDVWIQQEKGDPLAVRRWTNLQTFLNHSKVKLVDPISSVRLLCDRFLQYSLIKKICALFEPENMSTPPFVVLYPMEKVEAVRAKLKRYGLTYPVMCKPQVAHGVAVAHQMALVFNDEGLRRMVAECGGLGEPVVAQQYVPHNALLFKVFIIGKQVYMLARPSLKNFFADPGRSPICFDSHDVSKDGCSNELTEMDDCTAADVRPPSMDTVRRLIEGIQAKTSLSLFGMDIIVERNTDKCYVIDVNTFPDISTLCCERKLIETSRPIPSLPCDPKVPCYDTYPMFFAPLLDHLRTLLDAAADASAAGGVGATTLDERSISLSPPPPHNPAPPSPPPQDPSTLSPPSPASPDRWKTVKSAGDLNQLLPPTPMAVTKARTSTPVVQHSPCDRTATTGWSMAGDDLERTVDIYRQQRRERQPTDSGLGSTSGSESDSKQRQQDSSSSVARVPSAVSERDYGSANRTSAPPGTFPSWNRIKRFYGIPKPVALAAVYLQEPKHDADQTTAGGEGLATSSQPTGERQAGTELVVRRRANAPSEEEEEGRLGQLPPPAVICMSKVRSDTLP